MLMNCLLQRKSKLDESRLFFVYISCFVDNRTAELKQQLEKALGELEELRGARQREAEMVESIVRQRDMYRVLYSQSGASPVSLLKVQ
jgi:hypothetical protein